MSSFAVKAPISFRTDTGHQSTTLSSVSFSWLALPTVNPEPAVLFFFLFFASQLPLSKLDFCQQPSHAALVCIPLPVQPTVPEVDGFQVGANLHPHLGYSDECSRPVMTPPTPAGIDINCDTQFIIEPRERMFEHVKASCHHLCILQLRLA